MIKYCEAVEKMSEGFYVQYIGTLNGNIMNKGRIFCMRRGVIFNLNGNDVNWDSAGSMVYDKDFVYEVLNREKGNTNEWQNNE